jgi:hypothetical protein
MTERELLLAAAERVTELGHHKGDYCDAATGAVCAIGAMYVAAGCRAPAPHEPEPESEVVDSAVARLTDWLCRSTGAARTVGGRFVDVVAWNDAEDRTADEVVAALRAAAEADG